MAVPDTLRTLFKKLLPDAKGIRAPALDAVRALLAELAMRLNGCHTMERAELGRLMSGKLLEYAMGELAKDTAHCERDPEARLLTVMSPRNTRDLDYMRNRPRQAAVVLEYVAYEVLECAARVMVDEGKAFLTLAHVHRAVFADPELRALPGAAALLDGVAPDTLWALIAAGEPTPPRCRAFTEGRRPRLAALYRALSARLATPRLAALLSRVAAEEAAVQAERDGEPHLLGPDYIGACAAAAVTAGGAGQPEEAQLKAAADALREFLAANAEEDG